MIIKNIAKFMASTAVVYVGAYGANQATTYAVEAAAKVAKKYTGEAVSKAAVGYLPGLVTSAVGLYAAKFAFADHKDTAVEMIGFGPDSE